MHKNQCRVMRVKGNYLYYTITNPWVCSGVVPCACQYGRWKPLLSILGSEPFHLSQCQIATSLAAHKEWGSEGPTQLVKATTGGSTLGMEISILIPSGGLKIVGNVAKIIDEA